MASHVLYDCETCETLRFRHLGCDFDDTSVSRILHFAQGVGLVNAGTQELHKRLEVVEVQGSLWWLP